MNSRSLNRRHFLQSGTALAALPWFGSNPALAADAIPRSVKELWADFDPRKDALEIEVIREWKEDGCASPPTFRLTPIQRFCGGFRENGDVSVAFG